MDLIELLGVVAGSCTTLSFIPQIKKVWSSKSANDISFFMYAIYCIGLALWTVYGVLIGSISLIFANFLTLVFAFSIVVMKVKFERPRQMLDSE